MKIKCWMIGAIMAVSASAFADVEVTFYAAPNGATLVQGGQAFGATPFILKFRTSKKQPCVSVGPVSVRWISGAEATAENMTVCERNGKKQAFQFMRPGGVPGVEVDTQYAAQLQQMQLLRQQMALQLYLSMQQQNAERQAANQRNMQQLQQSLLRIQQNSVLQQQTHTLQQSLRCTSQIVGTFIYTNCQ